MWAQLEPLRFQSEPVADEPEPEASQLAASSTPATASAASPTKSKLPLYSAIAVAVLCLIIGGVFFLLPEKEEPLTLAQIAMAKREAEARAQAAAPLAHNTEAWQDVLRDPAKLRFVGRVERTPEGLRPDPGAFVLVEQATRPRNGAIRARCVFEKGSRLQVSARLQPTGSYGLFVDDATTIRLNRWEAAAQRSETFRTFRLTEPLKIGEEYELELRVVDSTLTARLNGQLLGTHVDSSLPAGPFRVVATTSVLIKSIEFLDLDAPDGGGAASTAEPWQDVLREPGGMLQDQGLKIDATGATLSRQAIFALARTVRNGAIRVRGKFSPEWKSFKLVARRSESAKSSYQLEIKNGTAVMHRAEGSQYMRLQGSGPQTHSPPLADGQEVELELRIVGTRLTGRINGQLLLETDDATLSAGTFGLGYGQSDPPIHLDRVEFLDLDTPGAASAAPAGKVHTFGEHRYQFVPGQLDWPAAKAQAEAMGGHLATITSKEEQDWIAATFRLPKDAPYTVYALGGWRPAEDAPWQWVTGEPFVFTAWNAGEPNGPFRPTDKFPLGVFMHGQHGKWDDQPHVMNGPRAGFLFEWDDLDAPGAASASPAGNPAAATKEAARPSTDPRESPPPPRPWVNSLGMKFVPVPITGGPTDGKRVLFSIWETRVQDYEVFASETKREWPNSASVRDATHPAVNVSWEDATAFCAWLTERERKVGRLGANEVYRLPSDHEWSCAVGVGAEEDATKTPSEKNARIGNVYPWGAVWPPPAGAGNFRGEECA